MTTNRSAAGIVVGPNNLVIVVNQDGTTWSLPKGHLDGNETARQAAVREIAEETGVTELQYIAELGSYQRHRMNLDGSDNPDYMKDIVVFLYTTNQTELRPTDPTNPEAIWLPYDQAAAKLSHQKDRDFMQGIKAEVTKLLNASL